MQTLKDLLHRWSLFEEDRESVKVLDNSFIAFDLQQTLQGSLKDQYDKVELALSYYSSLKEILGANKVVIPTNTIEEFRRGSYKIERRTRRIIKGLRKRKLQDTSKEEKLRNFCKVSRKVRDEIVYLAKDFIPKFSAEDLISDEINYSNTILPAVKKVVENTTVKISYHERHNNDPGLEENNDNDEEIFAKSLAINLSLDKPVRIYTCDSDFIRLKKEFFKRAGGISRQYNFKKPSKKDILVSFYDNQGLLEF